MRIKKQLRFFLLVFCLMVIASIKTYAQNQKIVRVGYILDHGFYIMQDNGELSGYNYEFLKLLEQFADWNYEFIEITGESYENSCKIAKEMLLNGEIDILGSVFFTDENQKYYEFPSINAGIQRDNLVGLSNNYNITQYNYFLQETLDVALVESADINNTLLTISNARDLNMKFTYVESKEKAEELLFSEEVDAILGSDMSENTWRYTYLTTIERTPFYFVAKKGNTALIEELEQAINALYIAEPELHQRLHSQYFVNTNAGVVYLSKEEEKALQGYDYFTVGFLKDMPPYHIDTKSDDEKQGISIYILDYLSDILGIEFHYELFDSKEDLIEEVATGKIDMIGSLPSDYDLAEEFGLILSSPYVQSGAYWLSQVGTTPSKAVYHLVTGNIPYYNNKKLEMTMDIENAILDLSKNGETGIFTEPNIAKYYIDLYRIENIDYQMHFNLNVNMSFGYGKHLETSIIGLLNRAIDCLDPFIVNEIINYSIEANPEITLQAFFNSHKTEVFFAIVLILVGILAILLVNRKKLQKITRQDSLTKLYNAGYFHNYVGERMKKITEGCLILIDIDYFKDVNDTYGHQEGDAIIVKVADTLKQHFRSDDIVARLGGDEFIILLEYKPNIAILEERSKKILEFLTDKDNKIPVSLSIGGYIFNKEMTYSELYNAADKVLYEVKEKGRNNYSFSHE